MWCFQRHPKFSWKLKAYSFVFSQGADWRFVQKNQMCVQSINPTLENRHVKSLHPYETIFVKYSAGFQHTISYSIAKEISENMLFEEVSS